LSSLLRLYDADNVVLGSVGIEQSVWVLIDGSLYNQYEMRVRIEQAGLAAKMRVGDWIISTGANVGLSDRLEVGSTVVFRPRQIRVEMTIRDQEERHEALGDLGA